MNQFDPGAEFAGVSPSVLAAARDVALLILDVDGVLTDGGLYYDHEGRVSKRFNVQDGLGIGLARLGGVKIAVITGQDSSAVAARMRDLRIDDYCPGFIDKREQCAMLCERHGLTFDQVAFLGDDWVDLPVMTRVGLPMAVANAQPEVKAVARYITTAKGGDGAAREVIRLLLHSRGQLQAALARWMEHYSQ